MPELYERLDGETASAFNAWVRYRDMEGEGSYAKVGRLLGKSVKVIERWASRWHWQQRLDAWIEFLDRQRIQTRAREIREMRGRHASFGRGLMGTGAKVIERINAQLEDDKAMILPLDETVRMIWRGAEIERHAAGVEEPMTQRTTVTLNLETSSELQRIHAKICAVIGVGLPMEYRVEPDEDEGGPQTIDVTPEPEVKTTLRLPSANGNL